MKEDIRKYCRNCETCNYKKDNFKDKAPLNSIEVSRPFEKVFVDLIGPLSPSNGFNYIIVFICALTKWVELRKLRTPDAKEAAESLYEEVFTRHGTMDLLIMDNGSNFISQLFTQLTKILQIERFYVTPFHPSGNGVCERVNGTIMKILCTMVQNKQESWSELAYILY